jgi:hypothetical protein
VISPTVIASRLFFAKAASSVLERAMPAVRFRRDGS